jgi:hypothetical protein
VRFNMYAVEFETKIEGGNIKIPSEYSELSNVDHAKLIIMYDVGNKKIETDTSAAQIDFSGYKVASFKKIKNPVAWQRDLREEW